MSASVLLDWLVSLSRREGSDVYLTFGAPPMLRTDDDMEPLREDPLDDADLARIIGDLTSPDQQGDFSQEQEFNMSVDLEGVGRFRVNMFRQRQHSGVVIRRINAQVPTLADLKLPTLLGDLCCEKRGLVIMVGGTGSGKSTSLAAMIDYRNRARYGHILTIEDPIEYVHEHRRCIVTQREVGSDTRSFDSALKNALRQRPDVILIGEIRDQATMRHALNIAETGHLALATLHANNADQAIERIVNFFALEERRLVRRKEGGRTVALEIMLNRGEVTRLIRSGDTSGLKREIAANGSLGMQTFDQHLARLWQAGEIEDFVALAEADDRPAMEGIIGPASEA